MDQQRTASQLLKGQQVVPVVVIENEEQARGLTQALLDGGVSVIEITLRNAYGLRAIELIKKEFPSMTVLAGTVTSAEQMHQVAAVNVDGVISPGLTYPLLDAAKEAGVLYLPGVSSGSEILMAMEYGLTECKLFPATVVGGVGALKAFSGPFPGIKFCPTGGISPSNYKEFLALDNVFCVGGSWLAPSKSMADNNWQEITRLCKEITQT